MMSRASILRRFRAPKSVQRTFFYDTSSIKEEYDEKRGVRDYLRNDGLKIRLHEHFKDDTLSMSNIFITEVNAFYKIVSSKEDIQLATKILHASFRDPHYLIAKKLSSEVANRYFVLCLNQNLPDEALEAWKLLDEYGMDKGRNLILRFRQLLFTTGRYRDVIDLTLDKSALSINVKQHDWRDLWFYMSSLYEIGDTEALEEASEWFWKNYEPHFVREDRKISVLVIRWLYSLLALKNQAYTPAYHSCFGIKDSICYQILLTALIETHRLEEAVSLLNDEVEHIKVIGTDIVRRLTASVKDLGNSDLHNKLIQVCGELDSKVRLDDRSIEEQIYDIMKKTKKKT